MGQPTRFFTDEDREHYRPVHVVWEITLACDLKCQHCGSRAGRRRTDELTTAECLDLVAQLARLGTREVTLIGGEAYLRRDWVEIVRAIRGHGMDCTMQSGGLHLNEVRVRQAAEAGLQGVGISIDGLEELHDNLRGVKGSYAAAFKALRLLREEGITTSVNTQITAQVLPQLRELCAQFIEAGAKNWQIQLTVAMGRAADNPELLLQPFQLLELMPLLAELFETGIERGLLMQPGNNVGYFGPFEALWRGGGDERVHWPGCNAGENTLGIEADGTIKGCPSLPTVGYSGGNVRDLTLEDIWRNTPELNFNLTRAGEELWGFCRGCYYADACRGGCTWLSHSLFGRPGNNPFCHHRALELHARGLRERVVRVAPAPGLSFDHGSFALLLETSDGRPVSIEHAPPEAAATTATTNAKLVQIARRGKQTDASLARTDVVQIQTGVTQISPARKQPTKAARKSRARRPPRLVLCRACDRHVKRGTRECPFCAADVRASARAYRRRLRAAQDACEQLLALLPQV